MDIFELLLHDEDGYLVIYLIGCQGNQIISVN